MARDSRKNKDSGSSGKGKVTFAVFQLEGSDETLQDVLKVFEQAMNRLSPPAPARQQLPPYTPPAIGAGQANGVAAEDAEYVEVDEGEAGDEATLARRSGPRKYTNPNFLSELELNTEDTPFKEFCNERDPQTVNEKYLLCAAWLTRHGGVSVFENDHIYTCFQAMHWKSQKDIGQPLRSMKKQSYFENPSRATWKITHVGLDAADAIGSEK